VTAGGRPARRATLAATSALAAWLALTGCGYSTRRLTELPTSTRTIAVMTFQNQGFRRDMELRLSQAVVDEVRARTHYAIGSADSADVLLSGSMVANESVVTLDEDDSALQKRLYGEVHVTLTDRRSGRVLKQYVAKDFIEYTPDRFGESLEGSATDEWVRRVAERVVQGFEPGF
jgi:outer membrane lipopolysaccharide assembly protein LptE/RlpB